MADERDGERRRKLDQPSDSGAAKRPKRKKRSESLEIGQALRSVYNRTVNEEIPSEMLDLLGKLG